MSALRVAEVNTEAIAMNVKLILEKTGGANLIAVVKANGYGHGAFTVAETALKAGASIIGVTELNEAFTLREGGFNGPILSWLHGVDAHFVEALEKDIELGVSNLQILELIYEAAKSLGKKATIHLKLDTGLSRGGVSPEDFREVFARAKIMQEEGLLEVKGVFSHLANTNPQEDLKQAQNFNAAIQLLESFGLNPAMRHLASSAAVFTSPHLHYNTVRVGLALYGLSPLEGITSFDLGLHRVMTLKTQVIATRDVITGAGVSYGYVYRTENQTKLALIPFGYADGMPRSLNAVGASVLIRGVRCPIIGRIAMDQCVIDLAPLQQQAAEITLGEEVILFGDPLRGEPAVEEWAASMNTINYEIVARLGQRITRTRVGVN